LSAVSKKHHERAISLEPHQRSTSYGLAFHIFTSKTLTTDHPCPAAGSENQRFVIVCNPLRCKKEQQSILGVQLFYNLLTSRVDFLLHPDWLSIFRLTLFLDAKFR